MSVTSPAAPAEVLFSATEALAAARSYAASISDGVIERDRAGAVPYAELAALDASGLLGITVPAAHFGPDLSPVVLAEVIRTIAAVDPAIAQIPQAHFLFVDVLAAHGSAAQQERLFADVLAGARLGNGLAERGGQHAQDLKTRLRSVSGDGGLRPAGDDAAAGGAEVLLHRRDLGPLDRGQRAGRRRPPGAGVRRAGRPRRDRSDEDWNVMGQRATVSGSAVFDQVPVDPALVIPYASAFEVPQQLGARAQLVHAAIQVGIAGGALRDAGEFVRTRARPFFEATRAGWADVRRGRPAHHPPLRPARHPGARGRGPARRRGRRAGGGRPGAPGRRGGGPRLDRGRARPRRSRATLRPRWPATCSRWPGRARPTSGTTCPGTGATPARTPATTPSIGSITMSATSGSTTSCRRTTGSSDDYP